MVWPVHERTVDTTATQYFQNSCLPNQTRIHTRYYIGVVVSFSLPLFLFPWLSSTYQTALRLFCHVNWRDERKSQASNSKVVNFSRVMKSFINFKTIFERFSIVLSRKTSADQSEMWWKKTNRIVHHISWQTATSWLGFNRTTMKMSELILSIASARPKWIHW